MIPRWWRYVQIGSQELRSLNCSLVREMCIELQVDTPPARAHRVKMDDNRHLPVRGTQLANACKETRCTLHKIPCYTGSLRASPAKRAPRCLTVLLNRTPAKATELRAFLDARFRQRCRSLDARKRFTVSELWPMRGDCRAELHCRGELQALRRRCMRCISIKITGPRY